MPGSWGVCPTAVLGWDCPACGSLRAVHHLTDGDLVAAASSNLLLVAALPVLLVLWLRWLWVAARNEAPREGRARALRRFRPAWIALALVLIGFTMLRNSAVGEWLHS